MVRAVILTATPALVACTIVRATATAGHPGVLVERGQGVVGAVIGTTATATAVVTGPVVSASAGVIGAIIGTAATAAPVITSPIVSATATAGVIRTVVGTSAATLMARAIICAALGKIHRNAGRQ